ncbi:MAG: enoyl-CoA hydratase/isomerase family protein [Gammaproteobacteria bacterium]|nr:enoyl-CoA hydratase/isomerase family protein [Gammaproteobacteria bacterium]
MKLTDMELVIDGKVARLTFKRPKMLNAINYEAAISLNRAAQTIRDDPNVRLVLIRGEGRAFCTGIDLKEFASGDTPHEYFEQWDRALRIFETSETIVLCAMHGYSLGGGLQLGLASDIRIATTDCLMGLPAIQESIMPGLATKRLQTFIGMGRAKQLIVSGDNVDGRRALELGLVDHVAEPEEFDEVVESLVAKYLATCSEGTRQSKVLMGLSADMSTAAFFEEYLRRQRVCLASPDHEEAKNAYREKRAPNWG